MNNCLSMAKISSMRTAAKIWGIWIHISLQWQKRHTSRWPGL
ncbi:hypothetical protein CIB84_015530 [Bambusicola thoracicus]|uniref:Uncharacterized protein n=1 Tax=Bambusicola thoracicus TaxID=9083 RepID=A0A2P4S9C7_BAMTH|nr:hypothetical protein CIB84_015530 [Bambusicola thoracicus]